MLLERIRDARWREHSDETNLADSQPWFQCDRHMPGVGQLECECPRKAWVDESGGRVHEEADATPRTSTLDSARDILRQFDIFERARKGKFTGVQMKWTIGAYVNVFCVVVNGTLELIPI